MTKNEVIATLDPGEEASHVVDAMLHMLELATWELGNHLQTGKLTERYAVDLAGSIDRIVETARKHHRIEMEAVCAAAFEFVPRAGK